MSYPRNAASPERVAIGAVVQISDGAVQTSGVAVKVVPFGAAEASGTGTVAYSADGVVLYTPVQGETNYTSFVLVASKAGCIPASTTVVTSASSVAGNSVLAAIQPNYAPLKASDYTAPANSDVAAIKAKTDNLPSDPADQSLVIDATTAILTAVNTKSSQTSVDAISATLAAGVELDSSASAKLARIEAVVSGTLSGAGTDTETFVGPSATVVITVDASGNRSNVSVT